MEYGKLQCIEARAVKQRIRDEYASKIDGYFFDNLIHMSDDLEEAQRTLQVLNKYKDYGTADYVRNGYQPIMENGDKRQKAGKKNIYRIIKRIKR